MANLRNHSQSTMTGSGGGSRQMMPNRWGGEPVPNGMEPAWNEPWTSAEVRGGMPLMWQGGQGPQNGQMVQFQGTQMGQGNRSDGLSMRNELPSEVIESPTSLSEAYLGSLKAMLNRNKGNFLVATFLIGTQNLVSWEGVLYDVGNDYVTIYQPGRDRYVVIDMYSLKYMEFYDTRRQAMCDQMLQERGWQDQMQR